LYGALAVPRLAFEDRPVLPAAPGVEEEEALAPRTAVERTDWVWLNPDGTEGARALANKGNEVVDVGGLLAEDELDEAVELPASDKLVVKRGLLAKDEFGVA